MIMVLNKAHNKARHLNAPKRRVASALLDARALKH